MSRATTGRRNRQKGQEYERWVCQYLTTHLIDTTWKRRTQTRGARVDGGDIEGTDTRDGETLPLWFECHNGMTSGEKKLEQAIADAPTGFHPIAIIHRPRKRHGNDFAMLNSADLLELMGLDHGDEPGVVVRVQWSQMVTLLQHWLRRYRA